jgi:hypothetical protein
MSTTDRTDLVAKVAIVHDEHIGQPGLDAARDYVRRPPEEHLTEFEADLLDWGLIYGAAWGIARSEDPFESPRDLADRALEAARAEWARWAEGSPSRFRAQFERDRELRPVTHAYVAGDAQ